MPKIIIADTSCFIALTNIDELDLLQKTYGEIITTIEVAAEYGQTLPKWVEIKVVANKNLQQVLELQIDKAESSAIASAMETPNCTIIVDNYKARKVAEKLGLEITGTIGVILKAKLRGVIPSVKPYLNKLIQSGFHLSEQV
jgi:hypothetical protein